ncbi:hypothetical protein STK_06540 [Sulfurisphaera tokodaii str. 7]|uniref:Uncharacterized protein n=1 Tax=Sulfurisphaera tokodaii (strain DSM 16993 / JCM 10545 / NBRC 100140 / 7) TaxID=273063 RepID=Q974K5_SULTO|nr:hypothetical protein STK_06540 [Sulfurisphaera tokodaii str. 7]
MVKILFLTNDKKFYYDGKRIKEVKYIKDLNGVEVRFARPMIVYDTDLPLSYFVEELGDVNLGDYTLNQLTQILYFNNSIVYVNHEKKEIEIFVEGGKVIKLPYSSLPLLRYYLAKIGRILLESISFEYLETLSYSKIDELFLSDEALSEIPTTVSRSYFRSLRRKLINNILNMLVIRRK